MKYHKGIVYYTFGDKYPDDLTKSVKSVRETNPDYPICWITDIPEHKNKDLFDEVIKAKKPFKHGWHNRTWSLINQTPYNCVLQLDSDTIILDSLDFGFNMADLHGMAIAHAPAYDAELFIPNTCGIRAQNNYQPIYNCGVIFFDKHVTRELFERWIEENKKSKTGQDQGGLSNAMIKSNFNPYVLTKAWNFRGGFYTEGHGKIVIWHSRNEVPRIKSGFFKI